MEELIVTTFKSRGEGSEQAHFSGRAMAWVLIERRTHCNLTLQGPLPFAPITGGHRSTTNCRAQAFAFETVVLV